MADTLQPGTRVELVSMPKDPNPIPPGTRGTVKSHRNQGSHFEQIDVSWDDGRRLPLLPGIDQWRILPPEDEAPETC